jgi:hypothetical protein
MRVIGFLHVLKIDQVTFRFVYVYIVELVVLNMHDIFTAGRSAIKNQYIYSISFVNFHVILIIVMDNQDRMIHENMKSVSDI